MQARNNSGVKDKKRKTEVMNKKSILAALVSVSLLGACGVNNTTKGAGIGVAGGALLGGVIGKITGNTGVGAAIGAVVGGAAGGLIGSKMDKQKRELEEAMKNAKVESINDGQAIRVTFDSGILFATGSSNLNAASQRALTDFANNLMSNAQTNIQIVGHTDNTGSDRVNDPLSVNRAKSVQTFLASKGVSSARMSFSGMGSKAPIADNSTVAGRQENRRVEVYILPSQEMIEAAQNGTLR